MKRKILFFLILFILLLILIQHSICAVSSDCESINIPFYKNYDFHNDKFILCNNQLSPPYIIAFKVFPEFQTDEKTIKSKYGSLNEYTKQVTNPSPESIFEIIVWGENNQFPLVSDGFGGPYSIDLNKRKIQIREKGPYSIQISGNKVKVSLSIYDPSQISNDEEINFIQKENNENQILNQKTEKLSFINLLIYSFTLIVCFFFGFLAFIGTGGFSGYNNDTTLQLGSTNDKGSIYIKKEKPDTPSNKNKENNKNIKCSTYDKPKISSNKGNFDTPKRSWVDNNHYRDSYGEISYLYETDGLCDYLVEVTDHNKDGTTIAYEPNKISWWPFSGIRGKKK